jgi:hypothetical protein
MHLCLLTESELKYTSQNEANCSYVYSQIPDTKVSDVTYIWII